MYRPTPRPPANSVSTKSDCSAHGSTPGNRTLSSASDNDKYVPAGSHQSHDLQPPAGAHGDSAWQGSNFSALSDLAKPVVFHAGARADQQTRSIPKSQEVVKQAGLGLASEKEGARAKSTSSSPPCQHGTPGPGVTSAFPRCHRVWEAKAP